MTPRPALALLGPTASGKSHVAHALARGRTGVDLVSVDSMQVYRGMDIGTAKPTAAERAELRYHLLDLVDADEAFTVARFQSAFRAAMVEVDEQGRDAVLVGGTGLYLRAVIDDLDLPGQYAEVRAELEAEPDTVALHGRLVALDPAAAGRMEPTNRRRVVRALEVTIGSGRPFSTYGPGLTAYPPNRFVLVGLRWPHDELDRRIEARFEALLAAGFVAEVEGLLATGLSPTARQALGYRELVDHLEGRCSLEEAVDLAVRRTRRFARRQERWFRRDPRVRWFDVHGPDDLDALVAPLSELLGEELGQELGEDR